MALRQLSSRVAPSLCRQLYCSLRTISSVPFASSASPSLLEDTEIAEAASAVDGVRQGWGKTVCRDILNVKADSGAWLWVSTQDTVFEAVKKMARANVGALLVYDPAKLDPADVSSASAVAGILTERDYLTKVVVEGRQSQKTFVSEIMTPSVKTVAPQTTVLDAMVLMVDSNIRHVPVVERNALRGMLSMRDVVHVLVREHKEEVDNLNNYIAGTY